MDNKDNPLTRAENEYNKCRRLYLKAVEDNQYKPSTESEELYWAERMRSAANELVVLRKAAKASPPPDK